MRFKHRREEQRHQLRERLRRLKQFLPQAIECSLSPRCSIVDRHAASIIEMDLQIEAYEYYFSKEDIDVPL
jgi:hypothetical protein